METASPQIDRRVLLQNALTTIDKLQTKLASMEQAQHEPIAIIGLSCRFPGGANTPEAYWNLLCQGQDAIREIPAERWKVEDYADLKSEGATWYGGFLDQVDQFDPQFFGITPREAEAMDPQQRLVLEVSWEALERAGQAPDKLKGSQTGIFIGITTNDYFQLAKQAGPANMDVYTATGSALNVTPGRVAFTLGLQGPSMAVDTACSSSLVAIHLACQSLRNGESNLVLAGGVNVLLTPEPFICFSRWGMMSPDGRCKTFDAKADGFVRSEGCGVIVLKRLSDALAAGDNILALIRGSAVNQDGRSSGLTVPNGLAQQLVVRKALANARLRPAEVSYVETHGTGTSLGDPIEIEALGAVLGEGRSPEQPLFVASVKTNIGHLESASGIAGLIKVVLSMQHQTLAPHLNFQERSPRIPWPDFPMIIPTELTPWAVHKGRRIAGISSFGFSGTNAHVILEEAPVLEPKTLNIDRPSHILALSAKTEPGLQQLANQMAHHLAAHPDLATADVVYTANTARAHFNHRLAVVADSNQQMAEKLSAWAAGQASVGVSSQTIAPPKVAFLFTGQGAQYTQMGRQLYDSQPTFRQTLDQCNELLQPYLEQPLLSVLYPDLYATDESKIDQTAYTQPALFALEYALATLWRSWGVVPSAVLGHSVGEYTAACLAGVFSLEEGLKLIAQRGRLMQSLPGGGQMAAVFADLATVQAAIGPFAAQVSIAAINAPQNIVISGAGQAIQDILDNLAGDGIKAQRLTVSHAFHSPLMDPILAAFSEIAGSINYALPQLDLISNLTGATAGQEIATAAYWQQHLRAPVRFAESIRFLQNQGYELFIEIGPKPTLLSLAQRCWTPDGQPSPQWLPSLRTGKADWEQMLNSLAALYVKAVEIDWNAFEQDYLGGRHRCILPTYPFQRKRCWLDLPQPPANSLPGWDQSSSIHPLLGQRVRSPLIKEMIFEAHLNPQAPAFLNDHRIYEAPLFPGTGYLEMAQAAATHLFGPTSHHLAEVVIQEALVLPEDKMQSVQIAVSPVEDYEATFQVYSLEEGSAETWKLHATGKIHLSQNADSAVLISRTEMQTRCTEVIPAEVYYRQLAELGLVYGSSFQGIKQIWRRDGEALGQIELPEPFASEAETYQLHPALLDAGFQLLGAALPSTDEEAATIYVPVGLTDYRLYQAGFGRAWGQAVVHFEPGKSLTEAITGEVRLFDSTGQIIAEINGLQLRRVNRAIIKQLTQKHFDDWLYEVEWQPQELDSQVQVGSKAGHWLIFADQSGVGEAVVSQLQAQGATWDIVQPGAAYQAVGANCWSIDPAKPEDFKRLLADTTGETGNPYQGIIHLWSLDLEQVTTGFEPVEAQALVCGSVIYLVQALAALANQPRLWLVTQGAHLVGPDKTSIAVAQVPLWGLGRTIALEQPELQCSCLDLDPENKANHGLAVFQQVWIPNVENQIALRRNKRYVARLGRKVGQPKTKEPVELVISTSGLLDNLSLQPAKRRQPGPGEVEVRVRATGLNFRDVLNALGMYPGPTLPLGNECTGVVVTVGDNVTKVNVGDEVIALVAGSFSTFVIAPESHIFSKPANLSFAEAATIPTTFLTAHYGLHHLAGLKPGDRVLIHAAAGGVGLAAVQLAQQAGAEIFGTAGSPEKRAFLQSIGVQHVLDSRTLNFADEIMALTSGAGVNIVLNSLANEFIPKSLSVLADHGHFLEIGKRDTWDEHQVAQLNPTLKYHRYDLAVVMQDDLALIHSLLNQLLAEFETAALKPLPLRTFPIQEASKAFHFMARAKHIGKVVVIQAAEESSQQASAVGSIEAQATYLITGGLGGLGLVVARWLAERGARHLVLMSRREAQPSARETLADLEQAGVRAVIAQADVSKAEDVARVLSQIKRELPPLRGIIHAAGVLDDGLLLQQNWSRFEKVMAPKIEGAWHLHTLTQQLPLEFFVLFSSGAALLGSPGQSNYAAANAFLDGLAHYRRQEGLPALSINWGAWAEVGMAANIDRHSRERWLAQGVELISPEDGVRVLETLLYLNTAQVAVLPANWSKLGRQVQGVQPLLRQLVREAPSKAASGGNSTAQAGWLQQLANLPIVEQQEFLLRHVQEQISKVLGLDSSQPLDPRQGLTDLGMDSLMAVEISKRLQSSLGKPLPTTLAFEYGSIEALTNFLATNVLALETSPQPLQEPARDEMAEFMSEVAELSEEALEDAVLKELENAGY